MVDFKVFDNYIATVLIIFVVFDFALFIVTLGGAYRKLS
jgi:hypothetical protein